MNMRRTILILLMVHLYTKNGIAVTFGNNKYNLVVAIHDVIKQDHRIIEEIKAMTESASEILYKTTHNRVCFGHVKILVPHSWTRDPGWSAAGTETFEDSDIRVDKGHLSHGSDPYTFHPGQCGESGRYIHLTDQYLTDRSGHRDRDYGDTGSTLVHEFAHLRYGVFDEYGLGTEEHPFVYLHEDRWLPTGCSSSNIIRNNINDINSYDSNSQFGIFSGDCQLNETTLKPDPSCFFVPDGNIDSITTSIMYHPSSEKIHFCESDPSDPDYLHNALAPNQHNKMCGGRGTWDVIMEHPDFLTLNTSVDITSVTPTFSVIYKDTFTQLSSLVLYKSITHKTTGEVRIDSTANLDVLFKFTGSGYWNCKFVLEAPEGSTFNKVSPQRDTKEQMESVEFRFHVAEVGIWTYIVVCSKPEIISLIVTSSSTNRDTYKVDSWLSSTVHDVAECDRPVVVYVHVHKGYSPVINADVTVRVQRDDQVSSFILRTKDDGLLPDNMADDGVYTAYVTQFTTNGSYSLEAEVRSVEETQYYNSGPVLYGGAESRYHNTTPPVVLVPAENFTRSSSPGAVDVTGYKPNVDNFPPSRVTDLRVIDFNSTLKEVTLTWTAPGDDLDQGNASRYFMRMSESALNISSNFTNARKVTPEMILSGTLIPEPAGTPEYMVIQAPLNWTTVVFALRTEDEVHHLSPTSNLAVATFEVVTVEGARVTTTTTTTTISTATVTEHSTVQMGTTEKEESPNHAFSPKIIGIIVGSILGAALLIVVLAYILKQRSKRKKQDILPRHRQERTTTTKNL